MITHEEQIDGDQLPTEEKVEIPQPGSPQHSYFQRVVDNDPITLLAPLLKSRGYRVRWGDGRLTAEFTQQVETPWQYTKLAHGLDCYLWHSIYFNVVSRATAQRFVPSPCQQCWKTVVKPKTLEGLFGLLELQQNFPFACKLGIELRPYVSELYGGYHYAKSQQEGYAQYKYVRAAVDAHPALGPETVVILKRACSEYERECGPSDKWTITPAQLRVEKMISETMDHVPNIQPQPAHLVAHVHRKWIEYAFSHGDRSYLKFTGGVPMTRGYVTYHHLISAPADPVDCGRGWYEYDGKKYHGKDKVPAEAWRNAELRKL